MRKRCLVCLFMGAMSSFLSIGHSAPPAVAGERGTSSTRTLPQKGSVSTGTFSGPLGTIGTRTTEYGTNGGSVTVKYGHTVNGLTAHGVAVTTPDQVVTVTSPASDITISIPGAPVITVPAGTTIEIPAGTTFKRGVSQEGAVTVTTTQPMTIGTKTIPAGATFALGDKTTISEMSNPNGLTNFNDATGWNTSTIYWNHNTGHAFFESTPAPTPAPAGG